MLLLSQGRARGDKQQPICCLDSATDSSSIVCHEWMRAQAQKAAGVDAVIMDDVGRLTKASGKASSAFNRPLRSPSSFQDVNIVEALAGGLAALAVVGSPPRG